MQPISAHHYGALAGAKTGPAGKSGNGDRKPVRRRRRQQRGGARLTLNHKTGKVEIQYA